MTKIIDPEVEAMLAKKFEGKLFVDICLLKVFGNSFTINKDFYTVKDGKACMVNDGKEYFTGDTMLNIATDCKRIGIYDPKKVYKRVMREYTYAEFTKLHKLRK
jgi:hypothetical protein